MPGDFDIDGDEADAAGRDWLTRTVQYRVGTGPWLNTFEQGSYEDGSIPTNYSAAVTQEIELCIAKTDLSQKPSPNMRFKLPRTGGKTYQPINVRNDETAAHWIFNLKESV
jgi:hypothetical protein